MSITADGLSNDSAELSLVWRCSACGRLTLALEPVSIPSDCSDCGSMTFHSAGPLDDPRAAFRAAFSAAANGGLGWPLTERRRVARN